MYSDATAGPNRTTMIDQAEMQDRCVGHIRLEQEASAQTVRTTRRVRLKARSLSTASPSNAA